MVDSGMAARAWVESLAEACGGYEALGRLAGLGRTWAWDWRRGTVPRARTLMRIAEACSRPADELELVLQDVDRFWTARAAHLRNRARCRLCGTDTPRSVAQRSTTYDAQTNTFAHRACRGAVLVHCPDCRQSRQLRQWELQHRKTRRGGEGQLEVRCKSCSLDRNLRRGHTAPGRRAHLQESLITRTEWLMRNPPSTEADRSLVEWINRAPGRCEDHVKTVQDGLRMEDSELLHVGGAVLAEQRRRRMETNMAAAKHEGRAVGGRAKGSRHPGKSRTSVLAATVNGTFALCRLCRLLVYRSPARAGSGYRPWHVACWKAWLRLGRYRQSQQDRRLARRRHAALLPPVFMPDDPRTGAGSRALRDGYRALAGLLAGRSLTELGDVFAISRKGVAKRIDSVREHLPGSWDLVFAGRAAVGANRVRQELLPLPQQAGPAQHAAAQRLARFGIDADTVRLVTGVTSEGRPGGQ